MSDSTTTTSKTPSRDQLRAKIFGPQAIKSKVIEFLGSEIEMRQPLLGDIVTARENPDRQSAVVETLVRYAYVPGTNERIFEDGDMEAILLLPFGKDFIAVSKALEELTDVNFLDTKPDLNKTVGDTAP